MVYNRYVNRNSGHTFPRKLAKMYDKTEMGVLLSLMFEQKVKIPCELVIAHLTIGLPDDKMK